MLFWNLDDRTELASERFATVLAASGLFTWVGHRVPTFSWEYVFKPRAAQWWVGVVFLLAGIGLGLVLPPLFNPNWSGKEVSAHVARIETDPSGSVRPVFQVAREDREYVREFWSNRTPYKEGEGVVLVIRADGSDWYLKADAELRMVSSILRMLGAVFFLIGFVVLLMTVLNLPTYLVHTVGGTLGALSFGLPASIALPALLLAHRYRPNPLFAADDALDMDTWFIGGLFTVLGLLTTIVTIVLARYQLRHKSLGWRWSSDEKTLRKR